LSKHFSSTQYRITLNAESRADLRAWHEFIDNFNGKLCFIFDAWISSDTLSLYSDAKALPGMMTVQAKCNNPTNDCNSLNVTLRLFIVRTPRLCLEDRTCGSGLLLSSVTGFMVVMPLFLVVTGL
jgi:hypothetical protein